MTNRARAVRRRLGSPSRAAPPSVQSAASTFMRHESTDDLQLHEDRLNVILLASQAREVADNNDHVGRQQSVR